MKNADRNVKSPSSLRIYKKNLELCFACTGEEESQGDGEGGGQDE